MKSVDYIYTPQTNKSQNNNILNSNLENKLTEIDIYNLSYDKWIKIRRANNESKTIVTEAILFIAAFEFLFSKNSNEIIFDSELLKAKTNVQRKQRSRYLDQLLALYNITFHKKYIYQGKVYRYIYSAIRTNDCLKILENPQLFYQNKESKKSSYRVKNDPYIYSIDNTKNKIDNDIDNDIDSERSEISLINVKPQVDYDAGFSSPKDLIERNRHKKEVGHIPQTQPPQFGESVTTPFLRDYKLTPGLLEELQIRSGTDFTHDRIISVIRNICTKNPDTKIFGGRNAFINYMIKALKNETEYKPIARDEGQSIADRQRLEYAKLQYMVDHKMTESEVDRLNIF